MLDRESSANARQYLWAMRANLFIAVINLVLVTLQLAYKPPGPTRQFLIILYLVVAAGSCAVAGTFHVRRKRMLAAAATGEQPSHG